MSKMTVIQLLNKIANGEEVPKKIRIKDREYFYDKYSNWYFFGKTSEDMFISKDRLNDEVEIIEEEQEDKKIEKIDEILTIMCDDLKDKIKEIVDKINKE